MKTNFRLSMAAALALGVAFAGANAFAGHAYKGENFKGEMTQTVAAPCPVDKLLKDGFYLGAEVGYDAYRIRESFDLNPGIALSGSNSTSATGFNGGLMLGYAQDMSDVFRLGGEIFVRHSTADNTDHLAAGVSTSSTKLEANNSYGVSLMPGIKLSNSAVVFAKVGYVRTDLKGTATYSNSGLESRETASQWVNGIEYGVGMEIAATDNVSLRGDYTYANYNNWHTSSLSRFSPSNNSFNLGVIYHFA